MSGSDQPGPAPVGPEPSPLLVIAPGSTPIRQYLRDLVYYQHLIRVFARRDVRSRYRQTLLGGTWVIIQPLLAAGVLSFIFGRVAKLPTDGQPYFLFAFASVLSWNIVSNTIQRSTASIISNAGLITKIFFPRLILPVSAFLAVLLDFAVGLVALTVVLLFTDSVPTLRFLMLPFWIAISVLMSLGIGCLFGALAAYYRDALHILPVITQTLLYLSPVAYSASAIPAQYRGAYNMNPFVAMLEGFRWSLLGTPAPSGLRLLYSVLVAIGAAACGALMLERLEKGFADVI